MTAAAGLIAIFVRGLIVVSQVSKSGRSFGFAQDGLWGTRPFPFLRDDRAVWRLVGVAGADDAEVAIGEFVDGEGALVRSDVMAALIQTHAIECCSLAG